MSEIKTNFSKENKLGKLLKTINNRNCKTTTSSNTKKSKNSIVNCLTEIKNNLKTFSDYMTTINKKYYEEFIFELNNKGNSKIKGKGTEEENSLIKLEMQNAFKKKMPYISRSKIIDINSIQIPDNQYVMKRIFNDIINLFVKNISFPGEKKCGLAYFLEQEWIYFTREELSYQKYIYDSNETLSLLYKEFIKDKLDLENLFTDRDDYILPKSAKGYDFEINETKYFKNKIKLEEAPNLMIKLDSIIVEKTIYPKDINFDEYFDFIKFNYIEIDGTFINDTKKTIILENNSNTLIPYSEINVFKIKNKDNSLSFTNEIDKSGKYMNTIRIKDKTIVFFQTKLQSSFRKLNSKNVIDFNNDYLPLDDMEKELAVVLYKMILYGENFIKLYKKIELIKDNYSVLFFLIFDNYPIKEISENIKLYLDILIQKKKIPYPFTIRPIYMPSSIDLINHQINSDDFNKKIEELEEKMEEDSKRREELEEKIKEDSKRREELEEKMEEDSKRREELEEKIEGDLKKLRELEEKMNEQMNKQKLANQNFLNMKKCDGNAIELAERIREKIEKELESKFKLYDPVGFKYELKENKEYYAFKVHIGDQKYIHVFVSGEKDNIDKMEINFSIGKDLFDPL